MNLKELNALNATKMKGTCHNTTQFDWEDPDFMDLLLGELPEVRTTSAPKEISSLCYKLDRKCREYNFFTTDRKRFLAEIQTLINEIKEVMPYWYELSVAEVERIFKIHKCCLISGDGGIGKSYFIKCFEEELEKRGVDHLCVYGKFLNSTDDIDFEEIKAIGEQRIFVLVVDAINELSENDQVELVKHLSRIKQVSGVRLVVTYRIQSMDVSLLQPYKDLAEYEYRFPGISFESAVEWLQSVPVVDIGEYLDVLYSNNPFLLSKLQYIMDDEEATKGKNNISRFTYIYEQFIKKAIDRDHWEKTKLVAKYMFDHDTKTVTADEISAVIDDHEEYISKMEQKGFLTCYTSRDQTKCSFTIESLADYLLARYMWNSIQGKSLDECVDIIKHKVDEFYSMKEMAILVLFDLYSPDYTTIRDILERTELIEDFTIETLAKLHFNSEDIPAFHSIFMCKEPEEMLIYLAGYINKPYNCVNYLNQHYLGEPDAQRKMLSQRLSGKHFLGQLKTRLKNMLYVTCKSKCSEDRSLETFYTALWCTAACNTDIRNLATKLLYEVIQHNLYLVDVAIEIFPQLYDSYIQDALIYVLSSCNQQAQIDAFFEKQISDVDFILAKAIRRMSMYLDCPYNYISLTKRNVYSPDEKAYSEEFTRLLHRIDLFEKELLPFRFWGVGSMQGNIKFLSVDKAELAEYNSMLGAQFSCVRQGCCNGYMGFERDVEKYFRRAYQGKLLDSECFLSAMEKVFIENFGLYDLTFAPEESKKYGNTEFEASMIRKAIDISVDAFMGSLMCNYYTKDFGTFNNYQDSVGYEVYDPLEFGEDLRIRTPFSIYQPEIEKMGVKKLRQLQSSVLKDEKWWGDLALTKTNFLNLLQPINHGGHEWMLAACRVSLRDDPQKHTWQEVYNLYSCASADVVMANDYNARSVTIELEEYTGNLLDYAKEKNAPWLCKDVPTISYNSGVFDDVFLILPPAVFIKELQLHLDVERMCWVNGANEVIIWCNNNRSSYYRDPIMGTVFVRRDAFEILKKVFSIKFFGYSEKYIEGKGFCDDTAYHFEIVDGSFVKEVANYKHEDSEEPEEDLEECKNCQYGFYSLPSEIDETSLFAKFLKEYGN